MENNRNGGFNRRPDGGRRDYGNDHRGKDSVQRNFRNDSDRKRTSFHSQEPGTARPHRPRIVRNSSASSEKVSFGEFGNETGTRHESYRSERGGYNNSRRSFGSQDGESRGYRSGYGRDGSRAGSSRGGSRDSREGFRPAGTRDAGNRSGYSRGGFRPAGRPGAGTGKPGFRKDNRFQKRAGNASDAGINRMISRKQQADIQNYSDNDMISIPVKEEVRLNKFIANSGICSRREADNFIQAGVVTVNGEVVTELGTKININTDDIRFNGERLKGEEKVYIVMNKPKGYVTTASDPHAEKTVMDLLKGCKYRVFPVGRLDKNTTGVLMFTNDGEIAEKLTHPSYNKKKIYQVSLDKDLSKEDFDKITEGVMLTDGEIAADDIEYIDDADHRKIGIEIHSGKNRIVRRIFESLGYEVKALDRVYFAGLTKKSIKRGDWRFLTEGETNILKMGAYV